MRSHLSPTLRSRHDYYYSTLSPASSAANFYENQNLSLFGDPVPPATDFLETLDNHLYGRFRRRSSFGEPPAVAAAAAIGPTHLPSISSSAQSQHGRPMMYHHHHHQRQPQHPPRHKPPPPPPLLPSASVLQPSFHQHRLHFAPSPSGLAYNVIDDMPPMPTLNHLPNTATVHHHNHHQQQQQQPHGRIRPSSRGERATVGDGMRMRNAAASSATTTTTTSSGGESSASASAGGQRRRPSGMSQQSMGSSTTTAMMTFGREKQTPLQHRRGGYDKEFDVNLDFR